MSSPMNRVSANEYCKPIENAASENGKRSYEIENPARGRCQLLLVLILFLFLCPNFKFFSPMSF